MTPKSLLRNKLCVSNLEDFSKNNSFHRVLWDHATEKKNGFIKLKKDNEINKVIYVLEKSTLTCWVQEKN